MEKLSHVAFVPSPGMGHLIPVVEFSRRLVVAHPNFRVTLIVPTIGQPTKTVESMLDSLPISVQHVYLPPVTFDVDPPHPEAQMYVAMSRSVPPLREVLKFSFENNNLSAIVFDMFSSDVIESVKDFNLPAYTFFTANAAMLSFCFYLPKLDRVVSGEYRDLPGPIEIPGCFPVHGRDLVDPVQDRRSEGYELFLRLVRRFALADGIVVNSFAEMEEGAFKALREGSGEGIGIPPVYAVGPLVSDGSGGQAGGSECLRWLDNQEPGSVLFVSFGSGGTLSGAQLNELANGLEKSGHKFLWVVRKPNDTSSSGAYFGENGEDDPLEFMPKGFLDRTKGTGLVVPSWAPQAQILSHASTGGFMTHGGWNSTLESVVNDQPLIVWPLYAEQKMNAVLLSEHLNVGLRPRIDDNGVVPEEEVSRLVKTLMDGEEGKMIRKRMKLLQNGAMKALGEEGDSRKALAELALKWSNHTRTWS